MLSLLKMVRCVKQQPPGLAAAAVPALCSVRHYKHRFVNKKAKRYLRRKKEDASTEWMWPLLQYKQELGKEVTEGPENKEPHMLHVAMLVRTTVGAPWWEKEALQELGLTKRNELVPLKNIPSVNKKLQLVNHLVEIMPLTFPHGLPEHESDFQFCTIKSNGEMIVNKRLDPEPLSDEPKPGVFPLQKEVLKKNLAKTIIDNRVHSQYHKPNYVYKHNQDGKEYRYTQFPYSGNLTKEP